MIRSSLVLAAMLLSFSAAQASDLGYHPALSKSRPTASGIDPSTFIPRHPAGGTVGHAPAADKVVQAAATPKAR
ncbi:hypothetical protein CKO44_01090 [Rubrivivax gelatinosus]|uniref:Uncharacterized protein n=1 Tax=Rubrivivax gelatinosus TaxID=28068 RepID=A0ABS1DMY5_RUBGE|nr:hypothetical protein [Rubrivivax gelatinosus]MBK1612066.1 hypothetical protein [Rubrivivax gelatinosus]MBK1711373.1 hypothetical protein [Rubrivivax gelatinosus]